MVVFAHWGWGLLCAWYTVLMDHCHSCFQTVFTVMAKVNVLDYPADIYIPSTCFDFFCQFCCFEFFYFALEVCVFA